MPSSDPSPSRGPPPGAGFYRALAENLTETLVVIRPDGEILYASPSFRVLSGVDPEAAQGQNAFGFIHPEDRERTLASVRMVADDTHPPGPVRFRATPPDGSLRILEASGRSLLDHPDVGGVLISFREVTNQVAMEERLQASQRMEAVGRLAGGIAHDFNNILTALAGNTEMLLEDVPHDSPIRGDLEESRRAIERAAGLTGRLLAFSRKQMMIFRVVCLGTVVRELEGLLRRVLESRIHLDLEIMDEGLVRVDVGQLEQVILNLVLNARDAMPRGGELRIEVSRVDLGTAEAARFHFPVATGPYLTLTVSDSGVGMDPATLERLFEPFFTTKPKGQGTGLGLAMAYAFAKQSMGYITAESTPGNGATFRLYLPRMVEGTGEGRDPGEEPG
jgi:two-component system cell cycle sensor histidine kinase/response regulator CckA